MSLIKRIGEKDRVVRAMIIATKDPNLINAYANLILSINAYFEILKDLVSFEDALENGTEEDFLEKLMVILKKKGGMDVD
jgi:hypothetical protein